MQKTDGGSGLPLGDVSGVMPADVIIIGSGTVGFSATRITSGLGARVHVFDVDAQRMAYIDDISNGTIHTIYSNEYSVRNALQTADLVIGAVLIPDAHAPKIIAEDMVKEMREDSVIVDVTIDQGGCIETCDHTTTHDQPIFIKHGALHYSATNMSGAVPRTSTIVLSNTALLYIIKLAKYGLDAPKQDEGFLLEFDTYKGLYTCQAVAEALDKPYTNPRDLF